MQLPTEVAPNTTRSWFHTNSDKSPVRLDYHILCKSVIAAAIEIDSSRRQTCFNGYSERNEFSFISSICLVYLRSSDANAKWNRNGWTKISRLIVKQTNLLAIWHSLSLVIYEEKNREKKNCKLVPFDFICEARAKYYMDAHACIDDRRMTHIPDAELNRACALHTHTHANKSTSI